VNSHRHLLATQWFLEVDCWSSILSDAQPAESKQAKEGCGFALSSLRQKQRLFAIYWWWLSIGRAFMP